MACMDFLGTKVCWGFREGYTLLRFVEFSVGLFRLSRRTSCISGLGLV